MDYKEHISYFKSYYCGIEKTSTGYSGYCPDLPGIMVIAKTMEKMEQDLSKALYLYIDTCLRDHDPVPEPKPLHQIPVEDLPEGVEGEDYFMVELQPLIPSMVTWGLENIILASGVKKAELARKMGVGRAIATRLTDPAYKNHTTETLEKVAAALGYEVEITFKPLRK